MFAFYNIKQKLDSHIERLEQGVLMYCSVCECHLSMMYVLHLLKIEADTNFLRLKAHGADNMCE